MLLYEGKVMTDSTTIFRRTEKTQKNPHGFTEIKKVPQEQVCIVCFGGDATDTNKKANGYAKFVEGILNSADIKDVPIYTIKYNFVHEESGFQSRKFAFLKHRVKALDIESTQRIESFFKNTEKSQANPKYIHDLYKALIQNRISKSNGKKKMTAADAAKNMRKINFVVHCHGGFTMFKLLEKTQREMEKLGYSAEEQKLIMGQTFIEGHAPACPLGKSHAKFYSFISAKDNYRPQSMNHFDFYAEERISEEASRFYAEQSNDEEAMKTFDNFDVNPSYIQSKNLFYIKRYYPQIEEQLTYDYSNMLEHDIAHQKDWLSDDGKDIVEFAENMLINSVKNSQMQNDRKELIPLPEIDKLILGTNKKENQRQSDTLENMRDNGQAYIKEVNEYALSLRKERSGYNF